MTRDIDTVLVSILQRRLKSITEEMSIALALTTRSPILCEAQDFVTGLYDADGKMVEQTENLPILSFSLGPVCEHIIAYFGDEVYPGDVFFHNDVFSWGNQNNDVAAYKPIFFEGTLVGWAACKGHQADIGGAVQGGYNPHATEVWQEALRIPPVKVYEKGKLRKDVWDLIFANIRLDIVQEDLRAQIGSCVIGERGLVKLIERYGLHSFETHKEYLFNATEKRMRVEIRSIPNGVYYGESTCYCEGEGPESTSTIRVKITVEDEDITFDYSDTDPQTTGFVNGTYTSSASATTLTFLQIVNPHIPHNDGIVRPLHIVIPKGTILNAAYPAATAYGNHLCSNNADAIMRALGPAVPDRVTAEWNELLCSLTTGTDPRTNTPYVDMGFMGLKGGSGAIEGFDGYDHIGMIDASGGVLDQDYEMFEQQTPHLLVKHEYWQDSAGAGRWRGGLGVETEFIVGSDNTKVVTFGDGAVEPARGAHGGMDGTLNKVELTYPDDRTYRCTTKDLIEGVPKGTVYFQQAGGGGGYGDPFLRPKEKVAEEVRNGVISREAALQVYGVAVHAQTFAVLEEETARVRSSRNGCED
jgi:N-methylhydantoinase B